MSKTLVAVMGGGFFHHHSTISDGIYLNHKSRFVELNGRLVFFFRCDDNNNNNSKAYRVDRFEREKRERF